MYLSSPREWFNKVFGASVKLEPLIVDVVTTA
eukprot:SAG11_NODE_33316_length_278_cov_0.569832_1_plen_31_part_01